MTPQSQNAICLKPFDDGHLIRILLIGYLRAVQLLLGHTKMDSTVQYFGVELEDALAIMEAVEN